MRGIRPAAQSREGRHVHSGDAIGEQFPSRKYVGIREAEEPSTLHGALCTIQEVSGVHRNVDIVLAVGNQDLVYCVGADGAGPGMNALVCSDAC